MDKYCSVLFCSVGNQVIFEQRFVEFLLLLVVVDVVDVVVVVAVPVAVVVAVEVAVAVVSEHVCHLNVVSHLVETVYMAQSPYQSGTPRRVWLREFLIAQSSIVDTATTDGAAPGPQTTFMARKPRS